MFWRPERWWSCERVHRTEEEQKERKKTTNNLRNKSYFAFSRCSGHPSRTDYPFTIDYYDSATIAGGPMVFILRGAGAPTHRTDTVKSRSATNIAESRVVFQVCSALIWCGANATSIACLGYDVHVDAAGASVVGVAGWANGAVPRKGEPTFVVPGTMRVIRTYDPRKGEPTFSLYRDDASYPHL
jgi:hypothetical protein